MSKAFNRLDDNGNNVKCSSYFHQSDEERKRRSTGGLDLMPDMDTEIEKCEIAAEEAEEMGEQCADCCEKVTDFHQKFMVFVDISGFKNHKYHLMTFDVFTHTLNLHICVSRYSNP